MIIIITIYNKKIILILPNLSLIICKRKNIITPATSGPKIAEG